MKTKLFLLCLMYYFICQVKAQTEFAPMGAEWYYTYTFGCCPENHFNHILSEKDTIVEENSCRVIRQYYDNSKIASEIYIIKQEQGKVYYYYQDQFNLLFDFDAQVNDTVKFTFMYKEYNDDFPLGKDTLFSARFRVESVTKNAQNLKIVTTKVLEEDKLDFWDIPVPPHEYQTYSYTEKKGLHREFMPRFDNVPHPTIEEFKWLRCYSDSDFSFVSEEWAATSLPCDYSITSGINTPKDENITIYPNPFNESILVFISNGGNIEIINVLGKVVYYSELSNGINEISTSHFYKGFYLVKIQNINNSIQVFKVIKS